MDPLLLPIYEKILTLYRDYPQVMVLTGDEYNRLEDFPDNRIDNTNCIVVCDNADQKYWNEPFHIDGAFSIEIMSNSRVSYNWWPYPEKPVIGEINIIEHIKKHHLPDEHA